MAAAEAVIQHMGSALPTEEISRWKKQNRNFPRNPMWAEDEYPWGDLDCTEKSVYRCASGGERVSITGMLMAERWVSGRAPASMEGGTNMMARLAMIEGSLGRTRTITIPHGHQSLASKWEKRHEQKSSLWTRNLTQEAAWSEGRALRPRHETRSLFSEQQASAGNRETRAVCIKTWSKWRENPTDIGRKKSILRRKWRKRSPQMVPVSDGSRGGPGQEFAFVCLCQQQDVRVRCWPLATWP